MSRGVGGLKARYLVTGGCGFIGAHLVAALVGRGHAVRVLDNLSTGRRANLDDVRGEVELVEGCLGDPDAVRAACEGVEVVLHQAALASVARSVAQPGPTHEANASGTLNVLQAAREAGVRRVVYA